MAVSVKANSNSESRGIIDATNNNNNNNNSNDSSRNNNDNNNNNNSSRSVIIPISGKEVTVGDTIEAVTLETESDVKLESKSEEKEDEKVEEAKDSQAQQVSQIEEQQDKQDQVQVEQAAPQLGQQGTTEVIIILPQEETGDIDSGASQRELQAQTEVNSTSEVTPEAAIDTSGDVKDLENSGRVYVICDIKNIVRDLKSLMGDSNYPTDIFTPKLSSSSIRYKYKLILNMNK